MARKDLLKNLMNPEPGLQRISPDALPQRSAKGAIGAVSQSIADLKARSVVEVAANLIDNAGLSDRLDDEPEGIDKLVESIRQYGQQVPVLLRHSPQVDGRYEVVYGRRRVQALKILKQPIKAMIRDLTDRELVIAQGQENAARKDLSFIEKAHFAQQMREAGYERKLICDALHIDKTVISRMLAVVDALPSGLIVQIGAAPSAGRDRWIELTRRAEGVSPDFLCSQARGENSDARFQALFDALAEPRVTRKPATAPVAIETREGAVLGRVSRAKNQTVLKLNTAKDDGFADWLVDHLAEIHRDWKDNHDE